MAIAPTSISNQAADMVQNRTACALGGVALFAWGLVSRRGRLTRSASTLTGAGLLYHAWTGRSPVDALRALVVERSEPMLVSDSVQVDTGRDGTYRYWRHLQNLPPVMERVESIEELDTRRSRWRVRTADGQTLEWESEITDDDPGRAIHWRSVDCPVPHQGVVRFSDVPGHWGTEITVEMRYMLPRGERGEIARRMLGDPQQELAEDLQRFKQTLARQDETIAGPHGT
jgi:uncharacterized membrane protein